MTVDGSASAQPTFSTLEESSRRLAGTAAAYLPNDRRVRVLELGCGTGLAALGLAGLRPNAEIVGVDISAANVAAAGRLAAAAGHGARVRFVAADYMAFAGGPFDLVFSDGVLHLIAGPTSSVVRKLAHDLRLHGVCVLVMPYDCAYNRALIRLRRVARAFRGRRLDELIIAVARRLYPAWPEAVLRERLPYMYLVPERLESTALRSGMAASGLTLIEAAPWPQSSVAKLRHRLTVFRKERASPP